MDISQIGIERHLEAIEARLVASAQAKNETHSVTGEHTMGRIMNHG